MNRSGVVRALHDLELRYRLATVVVAATLLGIVGALPLSMTGALMELATPADGRHFVNVGQPREETENLLRLRFAVMGLDEVQLSATIRISGEYVCERCQAPR